MNLQKFSLENFIEQNIQLIENAKWEELYSKLLNETLDTISNFNMILLKAGINPLEDLKFVPQLFLPWAPIRNIDIPDDITVIKRYAFFESGVDDTLKLPKSLIKIESQAFAGCNGLRRLVLPDSLEVIADKVFYSCSNLESVVMGENIRYIMTMAFYDCPNLKDIYYKGSEEDWNRIHMTSHSFHADSDEDEYPFTVHYNYRGV